MAKQILLTATILLLHIAAATSEGRIDAACRKAPDARFCASLLQPHASEFSDASGVGTGMAAVNATLGRVDELRKFMVEEAVREQSTPEELDTLSRCLGNVGNGEGALEVALQTLNDSRGAEQDEASRMIGGAAAELSACAESLKKHAHDDVIRKAFDLTEDSVKACFVARAILT
ncbi:hypothetical protein SASPL_147787 [Salvia splendens]|uniref:Pectinesterase inhibitor domain-containing protein n=1 Tax=Salvia splendens TaxID=180675 RepID=A0A8X8WFR9_SALSN|nr:hypothetical protein SASPL_147787 [Salvia splendens]